MCDKATRNARLRMMRLARQRDTLASVEGVEQRTSMNDARIALCIAMGRDLDDIDATSGHDLSREAYENVRASWRWNIQMHGWNDWMQRGVDEALANWREHRPEFVEGDDWLAGVVKEDPS
ncbi:hypothetical protein ACFYO9_33890 [Streptomyces sp. NPDC005863]|uniref:hypothetical protein n=1 Tax=Streptomyces sp. NPDC005863 TaxID=3364735 RepID=UPI00368539C4